MRLFKNLKARILKSIITWSEMGKQTAQAKEVYCPHELLLGRLRAAQGIGGVFRTGGFGRHRRQWVKTLFLSK